MVFFTRVLKRTLHVHPQHLGPQLERTVKEQLHKDVEGMTVDTSGYVVSVLSVTVADLQKGRIDHLTGFVRYDVSFNALVFRPFRNEVIVATVKAVSDIGLFAEAGPLQIFVSKVHIPSDMVFNAEDMSYSLPDDSAGRIRASRAIRLKVIGLSAQATTLCSVGTIKEDFLGLVD